ncbi:hypothetical protein V2W30_41170 (plasmid) [Streptomyces sp. Q6]|uniref:Uncharacterized protein n=1 Tax=Streptomyces citrinus TaxID=3118173 RepID=A0ACD5AQW7_9ACTN
MSAGTTPVRVARFYTMARQLPWVIGKFGDWRIPLGPFNAVQVALMSLGGLVLVKSASLWWPVLGPVPVIAWLALIFLCRKHRIAGRTPVGALLGVAARLAQPAGGRIGGRPARDRRPQKLTGTFTLQSLEPLPSNGACTTTKPSAPSSNRRAQQAESPVGAERMRPVRRTRRPVGPGPHARPAGEPTATAAGRRVLSPVEAALLAAQRMKGER